MSERPMQEPTFLILTALAAGPQHGYGVISDVAEISGGRVRLRAGTLYAALDRLRSEGLIADDREEVVDGRVRRYYRLTDAGGSRLAAEAERLRRHAEAASARLRARPAHGTLFRRGLAGGAA
ncbi:PadR family transcriptional regulator [Planomonospora alba]